MRSTETKALFQENRDMYSNGYRALRNHNAEIASMCHRAFFQRNRVQLERRNTTEGMRRISAGNYLLGNALLFCFVYGKL